MTPLLKSTFVGNRVTAVAGGGAWGLVNDQRHEESWEVETKNREGRTGWSDKKYRKSAGKSCKARK